MAVSDTCAIIDPLEVHDLSPLLELCKSPHTLKVLHAAGQDTEILHWHAGIVSEHIFDTQLAAALVGLGDQLAYARLVDQLLGVVLSKGESYSDWLQRPLSPAQIAYALDDVRYLLPLHDVLGQRLEAMGRTTWLAEECRKFANPALYLRDPHKLFRRIRRSHGLSSQGLAILRELAIWRDREARQRDRPPGSVLHDELLVEIARKTPRALDDLQRLRGFPTRELERSGSTLLGLVAQGLAVPESDRPQPLHGRGPTPAEEAHRQSPRSLPQSSLCPRKAFVSLYCQPDGSGDPGTAVSAGAFSDGRQSHPGRVAGQSRWPGAVGSALGASQYPTPPTNRASGVYTAPILMCHMPCYNTEKPVGKARRPVAARSMAAAFSGCTARSATRCNATAAVLSGNVTVTGKAAAMSRLCTASSKIREGR